MRPLLFLALTVAVGYLISRLLFPKPPLRSGSSRQAPTAAAEEMVRDPVCQLYLPRAEAIRRRVQGREYFFCSPGCLDKFLVRRS
jgi:YHS domain-containing protein